jgi:tRNA(fMet)-specific endonuclease VapC
MVRYLLDTNILSELVNNPVGRVGRAVLLVGDDAVCTSVICAAELRFGAARRPARLALHQQVEEVLGNIEVAPLAPPADRQYAEVRAKLEMEGQPIGANDLIIAAHALALNCTLVTANECEFRRVPGLKLENWLTGEPV